MKVTILLRAPFLNQIPSLKTLVIDLAGRGVEIEIISSRDGTHTPPDFGDYPNIRTKLVNARTGKIGIPTSLKLFLTVLWSMAFHRTDCYVGGDGVANAILCHLRKVFSFFVLEYPDIGRPAELRRIEAADYVITHDRWHGDFLRRWCEISPDRMLFLPNASYTEEHREHDCCLSEKFGIPSDKVVALHSGGLNVWFCSKGLARSAMKWSSRYVLVFHTGFFSDGDPYLRDLKKDAGGSGKVFFSTVPVTNVELDRMIASAKIGLAIYSLKELGYRAENMGLAAGKIGNYLKCGIPVVATKVDSLSYLEEWRCGILVEDTDDIEAAMERIMGDYEEYRRGAYRCYRELWHPKRYCDTIYETLSGSAV